MDKVMVIYSNPDYSADECPFPPIGALGTVISGIDIYGEYDVMFDDYPCPTPPDPSWVTHKTMIIFLNDDINEYADLLEEVINEPYK